MKLTFTLESAKQDTTESTRDPEAEQRAWRQIETAWGTAVASSGEEQTRHLHWVGGALALHASHTGQNATDLRARLETDRPLQTNRGAAPLVELKPGRSTPPPARPEGAQRVVDEVSTS